MAETESIRDGVFLLFVSSGNNNQNKVRRDWSESSPLKPANMEAPQQHGGFFSFLFFSSFFLLSLSTVLRLCPFSQTIQKSLEGCYRNCIQSDKAAGSRLSTRGRPCIGIAAARGVSWVLMCMWRTSVSLWTLWTLWTVWGFRSGHGRHRLLLLTWTTDLHGLTTKNQAVILQERPSLYVCVCLKR